MSKDVQDELQGIAIIGLSGRFPGAKNVEQFWENLKNGVESISFFTEEELREAGVEEELLQDPFYVKAGGMLEDADLFDAAFFDMIPREAEITDPQQRLFMECAWEAVENAGYEAKHFDGRVGVFAGVGRNNYVQRLYANPELIEAVGNYNASIGNDSDFLATRLSYKMNLTGPSMTVQTACSTSLVAVHLACQSLLTYESDMVLAGGSAIKSVTKQGYLYQEGGVFSPDGHVRAFDEKAQGMVVGNGVGVVVLKRLEDAVADGDHIYAVIKGSALNNDGSAKVGYTAPSVEQQARVIQDALAIADVEPETVTYIETHGTGTNIGDPIEIEALTQAFRSSTDAKQYCAIGSVKTNIGHLDTAAGITGLIKAVLALNHKMIPASLHFESPNPKIAFEESPFFVNDKLAEWKTNGTPRRAGVSSFGIGGTNAHVVLEEAPVFEEETEAADAPQVLMISAKTATALDAATENLAEFLTQKTDVPLADIAYTLQVGRRSFNHRRIVVARDHASAAESLRTLDPKTVLTRSQAEPRSVAFLFSGQGSQYANMALELYQTEEFFRNTVDDCAESLKPHLGLDIRTLIYPPAEMTAEANLELKKTRYTQPALFVIEYALAKLWMSWGVQPKAMIGHSIGEFVAATLAGVIALEDALALVAKRGSLMQSLPSGLMLAVALPEAETAAALGTDVSVAGINGPNSTVIAGPQEAVEALEQQFIERGVTTRRLETSHAFHSPMMEPILDEFTALVEKMELHAPQLPYLSNVTGTWITAEEATSASYYAKHLRQAVRFGDGVQELLNDPSYLLLEVGPGRQLSTLARQIAGDADREIVLTSVRHPDEKHSDAAFLLTAFGRLWLNNADLDMTARYLNADSKHRRVPLPTYPFERRRFLLEADLSAPRVKRPKGRQKDMADWFYIPAWKQSVPAHLLDRAENVAEQKWLLFADECGLSEKVAHHLQALGADVTTVQASDAYADKAGYQALCKDLLAAEKAPTHIAHFWSVREDESADDEKAQTLGFYSLIYLMQALGEQGVTHPVTLTAITNSLQEVTSEAVRSPERATIFGALKVIPQEFAHVTCRSIDVELRNADKTAKQLAAELAAAPTKTKETTVAYRGAHRFVQTFEKSKIAQPTGSPHIRQNGVYLLTGAADDLGLLIAERLAEQANAKLVLVANQEIPSDKLQKLQALGTETLVFQADVGDLDQMRGVIRQAQERFGELHGILHMEEVIGSGLVQLKTRDMADAVLHPKVKGALTLEAASEGLELDFLLLFSRTLGITGGFGQVDNTAANAFLGAFARAHAARTGRQAAALDVGVWKFDNWQDAQTTMLADIQKQMTQMQEQFGLDAHEGMAVLERVLATGLSHVIVSAQDFQTVLDDLDKLSAAGFLDAMRPAGHKIDSNRPYVAPRDDMEEKVAALWQDLFGADEISIHDNFFELGGNSLLAVQLVTRLRTEFDVELPMSALFESATVAELTKVIADTQLNDDEIDEIERMLQEIEGLSDDEIVAKLTE